MRNLKLYIRVNEAEKAKAVAFAKQHQYKNLAHYVRDTALKENKDFASLKLKAQYLTELRMIGNNLNQIARFCNTVQKENIYEDYDLNKFLEAIENINKDILSIKEKICS